MTFGFNLIAEDGQARLGEVTTSHGKIDTPVFMPVGTYGAVKTLSPRALMDLEAQIILSNTYHLMERPGIEIIKKHDGLHNFMSWDKPILTDSGGYQVFSLAKKRSISEEGVTFNSPLNGDSIFLSPESCMQLQTDFGVDIAMVLDECTSFPVTKAKAKESMLLSMRWAQRCRNSFSSDTSGLFGIVQGGMFEDLREESLEKLIDINFEGYAIGGLSVGESREEMLKVVDFIALRMPKESPRYLMGVGTPLDILNSVQKGIDMFDCVLPTRSGRTGLAFTWEGKLNLKNSKYKKDYSPINENIKIRNLNVYSKSYINHLINSNEILASMILTMNNIVFYQDLMKKIRNSIKTNTFDTFYNKYIDVI